MNNYEYSVQSSLIQQGMRREDLTNVEHVADVQELEYLLSDSLAKQRVDSCSMWSDFCESLSFSTNND